VQVLTFRHSPSDDLGLIGSVLDTRKIRHEYADLYAYPDVVPPVESADALIFMGGSMSVNDDLPFIHREIQYIRAATELGKPVLGVCLGAQLIAKALGARVYRNAQKEVGWAPVTFTNSANGDRLFTGFTGSEVIFHWHGETFDLPPGAELLAYSKACRNQAFRCGELTYGLQFHLEVTPDTITQWCREDETCGDVREVSGPIDPYAHAVRAREIAETIFGRWCSLVEGRISICNVRL
jgi:GMP synthase-like glutamine amidotransferase